MLAALLAVATLASGCGPDFITQTPVICDQVVRAPFAAVYPVAPDAEVSIDAKVGRGWLGLPLVAERFCSDTLRRRGMIASVDRCAGTGIIVAIGRRSRDAPTIAHVQVAGDYPN